MQLILRSSKFLAFGLAWQRALHNVTRTGTSGHPIQKYHMATADNIWWTRKARIQAEKRLLSNARHAQLLLLWYSFVSVGASVYYLKFNSQSEYSNVAWIVFSVLVLCVSGFINGLSYKERAAIVKDSYESLNSLYRKAKQENADTELINNEYEQILNLCENHTDIDYQIALCDTYLSHNSPCNLQNGLDRWPTKYVWFTVFKWFAIRSISMFTLYALPILIFFGMEFLSGCKG